MTRNIRALLRNALLWLAMRLPSAIANRLIRWRFPTVTQRSAGSLFFAQQSATPAFIDVRGITLQRVRERITDYRYRQPHGVVVLVCEIGYCSSRLAAELAETGFDGVVNLEGGLRALRRLRREINAYAAQRTA